MQLRSETNPRPLLLACAAIEATTGLLLLVVPSLVSVLILGLPLEMSNAIVLARVAGVALLALALACWLARERESEHQRSQVAVMFLYNFGAAAILAHAGLGRALVGILLWPAVGVHLGLALWCASLSPRSARKAAQIRA